MTTTPYSVGDILDCLEDLTGECDTVSVDRIVGAFGTRTYGPAIMVPALLELTPVGAIPGVPTFLAVTIALVAAQKMLGHRHLWLPGVIANRCVAAEKLAAGVVRLRPLARFLDRHFHRRMKPMTRAPFSQIAAAIIIVLCLMVPFLEVLPFASSAPMLAIASFGLAVLVRDGVLMAAALTASLAAMGLMGWDHVDGGLSDTAAVDGMVKQETIDTVEAGAAEAGTAIEAGGQEAVDVVEDAANHVAGDVADEVEDAVSD
ncbi:exopolysaccharide biosynthesis protein [Aurantiacibacter arachoides]|uniref:exopolysaccharide biosynthesis protein n=1 Tax=Aurantiacibacter arachoides TaxID=1850444 RepID=UPI00166544C9|nr:exopolysaccharide biosynthesis protein [Aurantiacibacter arachoides]GGD61249.1 hypothetical protein GCM10011411_21910 [Aurantiacibacter arachoides]